MINYQYLTMNTIPKQRECEQLQAEIDEFLANGGKIKVIKYGENDDEQIQKPKSEI